MIPPEPEVHIVTAPKGMVMREGLDKETAKVGVLKRGEKFHVLERAFSEKGELRLRVGPKQWVSETCAKTGERIGEPVAPKDGEQYDVIAEEVILFTESALANKAETTLKKGDKVEVIERTVSADEKKVEIFRTVNGWFAEVEESGTAVVERTLQAKPAGATPEDAKPEEAVVATGENPVEAADPSPNDAASDAMKDAQADAAKDAEADVASGDA